MRLKRKKLHNKTPHDSKQQEIWIKYLQWH
jgi:hypothetical protein